MNATPRQDDPAITRWEHGTSGPIVLPTDHKTAALATILERKFGISTDYYDEIYPAHRCKLAALRATGLAQFAQPSVYFAGIKS